MKCWAGWNTSWNQGCQEKCQQPQIFIWYHTNGRKRRGTKEPLDEGERGEWKSWLKTQNSKNKDHVTWSHQFMANRRGTSRCSDRFSSLGLQNHHDSDCSHEIKRCLLLERKAMTNLESILKKQRYHFANNGPYSQSYGFSSSHVCMWELDHKEGWAEKNWFFWTMVLEKTLESPLDCKEIKPVNPKKKKSTLNIHSKNRCWSSNTFATWCKEPTHWKRLWCWERLKAEGEGDDRGWDRLTASLIQWTWIWANPGRQWRTGKPGMLQSMGLQRVGHDLVTEQQQSPIYLLFLLSFSTCHIRHGVGVPFWAFGATTRFVKSHTHAQTLTNIEWAPYCWNLCLSQLSNFMAQYSHLLATSL